VAAGFDDLAQPRIEAAGVGGENGVNQGAVAATPTANTTEGTVSNPNSPIKLL